MALATGELQWFKELMSTFGIDHSDPMKLYCDSKAAIHIAANLVFHERTKHVELDCHTVRDAIQDNIFSTIHVSTSNQLADLFTKGLESSTFDFLLSKLDSLNLHAPI